MSKITTEVLIRSGTGCILYSCTHYGNSGHERLKLSYRIRILVNTTPTVWWETVYTDDTVIRW